MIILGVHSGHNAAAALVVGDRLVAMLAEEKVTNRKNDSGFPVGAITQILKDAGITAADVNKVVVSGHQILPKSHYEYLFQEARPYRTSLKAKIRNCLLAIAPPLVSLIARIRTRSTFQAAREEYLAALRQLGLPQEFEQVEHHACHAYAAYYALRASGDDRDTLVITLDGSGDDLSGTVATVKKGKWERLSEIPASASLGNMYAQVTRFLGMKILEHEYKVMGLAAYSKGYHKRAYEEIFRPFLWQSKSNPLTFESKYDTANFDKWLRERAVGERFDNLAGGLQQFLEEQVTALVRAAIAKTGIRRLFLGGGVFMNVKLNKRIQEIAELAEVQFMPSCGDETNALGAAYHALVRAGVMPQPMQHLYWGTEYSETEIEDYFTAHQAREKYDITRPDNINQAVAELLAKGEVVAHFAGRSEFGARALGNRSILANPSDMQSFYMVNDLIKARDFWMPFAPSMLDTHAEGYLVDYNPQKNFPAFMITAYQATPLGRNHLRAAMHQGDGTLRPQVVTPQGNAEYYDLIQRFEKLTSIGAVLNTSLNLHGYPLVSSPAQAFFTLENSGMRNLAIGPFLVRKK